MAKRPNKTNLTRNAKQISFYVHLDKPEDAPVRAALRQVENEERNLSVLLRDGLVLRLAIENRNFDLLAKMLPLDVVQALMPAQAPVVIEVKMPQWKAGVQLPLPIFDSNGKEDLEADFDIEDGAAEAVAQNMQAFDNFF